MKILILFPVLLGAILTTLNISPNENPEGGDRFLAFIENFDQLDLPHTITYQDLEEKRLEGEELEKAQATRISYEYKKYIPGVRKIYSRVGPDAYHYAGLIAQTNNYVAVLIGGHRPFADSPQYYKLVVYSPKGKVIDDYLIAKNNYGTMTTAKVDENLEISMQEIKVHYDDIDYDKIVGTDITKIEKIKISSSGKIIKSSSIDLPKTNPSEGKDNTRASLD